MKEIRHIDLTPGNPLPPGTQVWRYVPLKTLLVNLSGKVFIPSISILRNEDPFEAEFYYTDYPTEFNSAIDEWYGSGANIFDWIFKDQLKEWQQNFVRDPSTNSINCNSPFFQERYFEFTRSTRFAWCWFAPEKNVESAAMWNTYGKDGAAIVTTVERLLLALKHTHRDFEYGRMHYVHADDHGRVNNHEERTPRGKDHDHEAILRPHFFKRAEYQTENEIRFVTADSARSAGGLLINLPAYDWIDEVRLWLRLSSIESKALEDTIRAKLHSAKCKRSRLIKNAAKENLEALAAQVFEPCWQTNALADDNIPPELKRLWPIRAKP